MIVSFINTNKNLGVNLDRLTHFKQVNEILVIPGTSILEIRKPPQGTAYLYSATFI
jgi:hypothetical protein